MKAYRLSLRMLTQDWRAGELRALALALILAVAATVMIASFVERIDKALNREASSLIAADLIVVADHPIPQKLWVRADKLGLRTAQTTSFLSLVVAGTENLMSEIKAVGLGYPLRGELQVGETPYGAGRAARSIPTPGTVWVESRLLSTLKQRVGASLSIGSATFTVAAVILQEPDASGEWFRIAPRVMLNESDLSKTSLIQEGSRVTYRMLISGEAQAILQFRKFAELQLGRGEKILGVGDARPEVRSLLERANHFLNLATFTSLLMAVIAVALSAKRFVQRHLEHCAVLQCFGARQSEAIRTLLYEVLTVGSIACIAGCLLGYMLQDVLAGLARGMINGSLPAPTFFPAIKGLGLGLLVLLGFAYPAFAQIRRLPVALILQQRGLNPPATHMVYYLAALAILAATVLWQVQGSRLATYVILGAAGSCLFAYALIWLAVVLLQKSSSRFSAAWRYGLRGLKRATGESYVQVLALCLGIMIMLILTFVWKDLLHTWQTSLPEGTPDRFAVNIQPDQLELVQAYFASHAQPVPQFYPMVKGRLLAINDKPVSADSFTEERAKRLAEREFNLSWAKVLPQHNEIVAGRWWNESANPRQFSVESGIAQELGIKLGDVLTYAITGETVSAPVSNLRKVDWGSFQVNFFVAASPGLLESFPSSYITSFYLPGDEAGFLAGMVARFPNLSLIDVAAVLRQVKSVMEHGAAALQLVFLFTLLAGAVTLYAALHLAMEQRIHEVALLRTLGIHARQLWRWQNAEFVITGAIAGIVAAGNATLIAWLASRYVFEIEFAFNLWLWLAGAAAGILITMASGWLAIHPVLKTAPLLTLRQA